MQESANRVALNRVALGLSYNGSRYLGWQTQSNKNTIQDTLEYALSSFLNHTVATICAGRTDTGVHALNQVVHLDTHQQRSPDSWVRGLNSLLPNDIAVNWYSPVANNFNARYDALKRTYVYIIRNCATYSPFFDARAAWIPKPLNIQAMRDACQRVIGQHDFSAFRSSQCQAPNPVRTIYNLQINQSGNLLLFYFTANAYLHHMIRNIMGALIAVGMEKQNPEWLEYLIKNKDRKLAAPTFLAHGLYLIGVEYKTEFNIPCLNTDDLICTHLGISTLGNH